jgi:hypothetical protein
MSVSCSITYSDGIVTTMTVWDDMPGVSIGRALNLSIAAYESRMKRPPPVARTITLPHKTYTIPHILELRYTTDDGETGTIGGRELMNDLLFGIAIMG